MIKTILNQPEPIDKLPIFAKEKYLRCKSNNYGWFVSNTFIIPFFLNKKYLFKRLVFTHMPISLNGCYSKYEEEKFLNEMVRNIKISKLCDYVYMAQSNVVFNTTPDDCDYAEWGTYLVDLRLSNEELLSSFHQKHRNVIKKAISLGVTIEKTKDYDLIYRNIKDTLIRNKSIHYPSKIYLKNLIENVSNNVTLYVAKHENKLQGTAVVLHDNLSGYYMYGGSIEKPCVGSLNYLQYIIMLDLKSINVPIYDLVGARIAVKSGSKYEGIQKFKSRFGAKLHQGYTFKVIIKPFKYKLFNILVRVYSVLRGIKYSDPIDQLKTKMY